MSPRVLFLAAAALVAAACAGTAPRPEPRTLAAYRDAQTPPVYALLGQREELALSSDQVNTIDSIAEALQERNRPLADQLRGVTGSGAGGPVRRPRSTEEEARFLPVLEEIGRNNREAMDAVGRVLTEEQRGKVCRMRQERARERSAMAVPPGRDTPGRVRPMRGRGMPMDSATADVLRRGGVWSWCPPPAPAQAQAETARG